MGVWRATIFGDDTACDVRDEYRELIEDGVGDQEATRRTLERFKGWFESPEGTSAIVALAVTQSKLGRLSPEIRDLALAAIDSGGDLAIWNEENPKNAPKRKAALEAARAQLTGPQPAPKRLKPPRRLASNLVPGDVLAFDKPEGPVLLRVVRVKTSPRFETPLFEELEFGGSQVPSAEAIADLPARQLPESLGVGKGETRFEVMLLRAKDMGWREAGFRKVATIPQREGDEGPNWSGRGIFWSYLAKVYSEGKHYPA